jgi:hypothetical protein
MKTTVLKLFSLLMLCALISGCAVNPSLKYGFEPAPAMGRQPVGKIVVMKPQDIRTHAGTTPGVQAYIPFYPYVRQVREPEAFTYEWNGYRFDYELDFAELVAMDLRAAGLASDVSVSPDIKRLPAIGQGKNNFIVKLSLNRLEWQHKFTLYGISVLGFLPEALGAPDQYGFSFLDFNAEVIDSSGKTISSRKFSAVESQNGWLYYFSGFLRALTDAYVQVSPEFRSFVASAIQDSEDAGK